MDNRSKQRPSHLQAVFVRDANEASAMAWWQRDLKEIQNFLRISTWFFNASAAPNDDEDNNNNNIDNGAMGGSGGGSGSGTGAADQDGALINNGNGSNINNGNNNDGVTAKQWRLESVQNTVKERQSVWLRILSCGLFGRRSARGITGIDAGINPNQQLALYLHWLFQLNVFLLFWVMCFVFFTLVVVFAGLITLCGRINPQCVRVSGEEFDVFGTAFADAFSLSWTTFSTVGYGSAVPALGYQNQSPTNCFFINFICAFESLLGVLYSGFCGALLFGKILRVQNKAQVVFSDPLLIRYGVGLCSENQRQDGEDERDIITSPCPVLEFRLVNRLYYEQGSEIMDTSLNVVANITSEATDMDVQEPDSHNNESTVSESSNNSDSHDRNSLSTSFFLKMMGRRSETIVDDSSSKHAAKQLFSKMEFQPSEHPFFRRVWLVRHALDEHSPILKHSARQRIRRNNGAWPEQWHSPSAIRNALQFNQILVSLHGVSNVSACDVYALKIYDYGDINIGYKFMNVLYRDDDGNLGVDIDLLNDVREQPGGGGEPLYE